MVNEQKQIKFKLTVNHSFSYLNLSLTFSGSENIGVYNLKLPDENQENHWRDVALVSSDWKILCNTIRLARLDELPLEEPESEWMEMDGGQFTLKIEIDDLEISRTRSAIPERSFCVVVNKMIDLVPQLDKQLKSQLNLKDHYKFNV
jgi:hypothetical protein